MSYPVKRKHSSQRISIERDNGDCGAPRRGGCGRGAGGFAACESKCQRPSEYPRSRTAPSAPLLSSIPIGPPLPAFLRCSSPLPSAGLPSPGCGAPNAPSFPVTIHTHRDGTDQWCKCVVSRVWAVIVSVHPLSAPALDTTHSPSCCAQLCFRPCCCAGPPPTHSPLLPLSLSCAGRLDSAALCGGVWPRGGGEGAAGEGRGH